jgi:hypothetical protein
MKKILIVDDEPNIVMSLEYTFKKIILKYSLLVTDKKHWTFWTTNFRM